MVPLFLYPLLLSIHLLNISFTIFASGYLDIFQQSFLMQWVICCGIITSAFTSPIFQFFVCLKTHKFPIQFFYIACKLQACFMTIVSFALLCLASPLRVSFPRYNTITFPITFLSLPLSCLYLKIAVVVVTTVMMQ